ncbi:metalloregulator ArsR/SmtB family transcription factor [Veronia pacifica]|uniref:Transcriptional regulator n=1 Tax=Veronia pacifica TaxID=1080227 RepID=A0A1C3EG84_9GAMM|nr:metalloregulator ArsR/SmtB family transcription factor [Veronia pacifica]ODA32276.1 transcriptional regulator [Veronia pacifica]
MCPLSFFKCLADETRLSLILLIKERGELCVCDLITGLALSQPKISRHLAQLRKCGLLVGRKQGQWVFYQINPELEKWCLNVLNETLKNNDAVIERAVIRLDEIKNQSGSTGCC